MTALLDVNVLIALLDPEHVHHVPAHRWFAENARRGWATCPITENGFLRIVGRPSYPNWAKTPADAASLLEELCLQPGHVFWPDSISLVSAHTVDRDEFRRAADVTDIYLLALAVARHGKFATFDHHIATAAVPNGADALVLIE